MDYPISRRNFLKASALAGALVGVGHFPFSSETGAASSLGAPTWIDRPMRWAQLTLVEDDPGKFDPQFWLDYFKRMHSDACMPERGRLRRLLPDKDPVSSPQCMAW
jgi:hypothetical protein